jgi:hypothetical protein
MSEKEKKKRPTAIVPAADLPAAHPDVGLPHIALLVFSLPPLMVIRMTDFPSHPSQEIGPCDGPSAI